MRHWILPLLPVFAVACASMQDAPRKVSASAYNTSLEPYYLVVEAGRDRGIYRRHGIDPQWVERPGRAITAADLRELAAQGTRMGLSSPSEIFLARTQGVPVRIVAGFVGETMVNVYAKADGGLRSAADLSGRKIGPTSAPTQRQVAYLARALNVDATAGPVGSVEQQLSAIREGRIDAIITAEMRVLRHVQSGELKLLVKGADYRPRPELNNAIWATDEAIANDHELVARFVKATLESVHTLRSEPSYAATLLARRPGVDAALADIAARQIDWIPSGQPGADLVAASRNYARVFEASGVAPPGSLKLEDVVETRFVK